MTAGSRGTLQLPPGRELHFVGDAGLAALAKDDLAVEYLEVYQRPEWATPGNGR
jgi:hypothetical protein